MDNPVAMTGPNGFVGSNLRILLNENKMDAVCLARKKIKTRKLEKPIIFSDLCQGRLAEKLRGCKALVHLVGTGSQTIDADFEYVNVEMTKKALDLCKKAGIGKIIYLSGLGVNDSTTSGYFISKLKAERLIIDSGLDYTIFRASYIIGKDDPLSKNLRNQMRRGCIEIPGSGRYRLQPISVKDVSKIILICIDNKKFSNKIIDLVGPQTLSFEKFVRWFAKGKTRIVKTSLEKAYFEALNYPTKATYGLDDLNIMVGDFTSDNKKLENLCGFKLKTLEQL